MFCLSRNLIDEFKKRLKSGELDIEKLAEMSSKERRDKFAEFMGEDNAVKANKDFETKLLLKNQQRAMVNWAKQLAGLKPEARRDLLSRIEKMDEVLNPANEKAFLEDLAAHKLGVAVTMKEASIIADLSKKVIEAKKKVSEDSPDGSPERMAHGYAVVQMGKFINELKNKANATTLLENIKDPAKLVSETGALSKAMNSTGDNSAVFRQGWSAMITNPKIWAKNAIESFSNIAKSFGGKEVLENSAARIISSKNYEKARKAKLAVANVEENFPTSLPEKIPLFGRVYKATEEGFTAFLHNLRMDLFNKEVEVAESLGVNTSNKEWLESTGKLINSLTGRGDLGKLERAGGFINNIFFSARALKGHIDVYTAHLLDPKVEPYVKKRAAINLLKIIAATASINIVANALMPGSVQPNPQSSDFGKIKSGNTRFDITGGGASILTLAARLYTGYTKNTTSGQLRKIDPVDAVGKFFENKLSPLFSTALAVKRKHDRDGNKIDSATIEGQARILDMLFTPMPIKNIRDSIDENGRANLLLIAIADALGINTNTYSNIKKKNS